MGSPSWLWYIVDRDAQWCIAMLPQSSREMWKGARGLGSHGVELAPEPGCMLSRVWRWEEAEFVSPKSRLKKNLYLPNPTLLKIFELIITSPFSGALLMVEMGWLKVSEESIGVDCFKKCIWDFKTKSY